MADTNVRINVGYNIDKSGLQSLKASLQELQRNTSAIFKEANKGLDVKDFTSELIKIKTVASSVESALEKAFNPKLGTVNVQSFNKALKEENITIEQVYAAFSKMGATGQNAFRNLVSSTLSMNKEIKQTKTLLDKMGETLGHTIKWNIASAAINTISGKAREAYGYVKSLDTSLNNIRIVTEKSAEDMDIFAEKANKAAKALGATTTDYTNAALTFYQQGLNDQEVQARADLTLKVANASGLSADDSAEYVTAVLNGYKVGSEEAEKAMDILARVGADTASSLDELSEAMSKTASTANAMGMTEEQLASSLATVIQVTRQDASSVGTAFKTILMRISDIEAGTEDAEVSLGNYTGEMAKMGVNVLDSTGKLRDMGSVVEEVGDKWAGMSREQQIALARTMAGTRQANNLLALFDNWDTYKKTLESAENATGTLQKQQDIYMESTRAHLDKLTASAENLFDSFLDSNTINDLADAFGNVLNGLASFTDAIGGGKGVLLSLGSTALTVFNKQIGKSLGTVIAQMTDAKVKAEELKTKIAASEQFKGLGNEEISDIADKRAKRLQYGDILSDEQRNEWDRMQGAYESAKAQQATIKENQAALIQQAEEWSEIVNGKRANFSNYFNLDTDSAEGGDMGAEIDIIREKISSITDIDLSGMSAQMQRIKESEDDVSESAERATDNVVQLFSQDNVVSINSATKLSSILEELDSNSTEAGKAFIDLEGDVQRLANIVGGSEQQGLQKAWDAFATKLKESPKEVAEEYKVLVKVIEDAKAKLEDSLKGNSQGFSDNSKKVMDAATRQAEESKKYLDDLVKSFDTAKLVSQITQLTGGVGQLVSGLTSLKNVKEIWNNNDLSTFEKTTQLVESTAMGLTMLISGFANTKKAIDGLKESGSVLIIKLASLVTGESAATMTSAGLGVAIRSIIPGVLAVTAAIAALTSIIYLLVKAHNAERDAAKNASAQAEALAENYSNLKEKADSFKEAISDYSDAKTALAELDKTTDEYGQKLDEVNEKAKNLIETYKLFGNYSIDENGVYQLNQDALDSINEQNQQAKYKAERQNYLGKVGLNSANIRVEAEDLKDSISGLSKEVTNDVLIKAIQGITEEQVTALKSIDSKDFASLQTVLKENTSLSEELIGAFSQNIESVLSFKESLDSATEENEYYVQQLTKSIVDEKFGDELSDFADTVSVGADQLELAIAKVSDDLASSGEDLATKLSSINVTDITSNLKLNRYLESKGSDIHVDNDEDLAREYAKMFIPDYDMGWTYDDGWGKGNFTKSDGTKLWSDDMSEKGMRQALARAIEEQKIIEEYTGNMEKNTENVAQAMQNFVSALETSGNGKYTTDILSAISNGTDFDFSDILGSISQEEHDTLMNSDDLLADLGLSNFNEWSSIGYDSAKSFLEAFRNELNNWDISDWYNALKEKATNANSEISSIITGVQTGDITGENITDNEEYTKLIDNLNELKEQYPELTEAADKLSRTWLVGTQEYNELLEATQNSLAKIEVQAKEQSLSDSSEKARNQIDEIFEDGLQVQVSADLTDFEDSMDDVLDNEYDVNVAIHTEAEQEFDNFVNAVDNLKEQASKIGDDFVVAADDVRELNNVFPGIIEGYESLGDGRIQLKDTVVQAAIEEANAEAESDAASTTQKLEDLKTVLEGKQATYEQMATAAHVLAGEETDSSMTAAEARDTISTNLGQNITETEKETTDNSNNFAAQTANAYDQNFGVISGNAAKVAQSMDDSFYTATSNMASYIRSVANQQTPVKGSVNKSSYKGSSAIYNNAQAVNDITKKALDNPNTDSNTWSSIAKKYEELAKAAGSQINDINGMIAQIGAKGVGTAKALGNIYRGTGSGGRKSNSGSGSGSSARGNSSEPDTIDLLDEKIDRYHKVDIRINQLNTDLSRLQTLQDKLTGKELLNNLNKQLDILEKQRDTYHDKVQLAKQEKNELYETLKAKGVQFDGTNGTISNYATALTNQEAYVNSVIAKYNAMSADEQKTYKDVVEQAKKEYETFKDNLDKYDELISDTIPELEDKITDALLSAIEIQVQKFDMEVKLRLDMGEAMRDWNEFKRKVIDDLDDDDLLGKALQNREDILSYYNTANSGVGSIQSLTSKIGNTATPGSILGELQKMQNGGHSSIYSAYDAATGTWVDDMASAVDDLKESYKELMTELENLEDLEQNVTDAFLDSIDAVNDALDKNKEAYEFLGDQIDHDINLIQKLYGDDAYDLMDTYYEKQLTNIQAELAARQNAATYWKQLMDAERAAIEQGNGNKEALEKYEENWKSAVSDVNGLVESWAEALTTKYENTIDALVKSLNDKVSNGKGLDYLEEQLNLLNDNADNYLDTINAAYAKQQLQNKWQDAINDTDSVTTQQKLNELMQAQMKMLEEKGELTQYDIDRAEKEYEIALKQIALQEAQQNKSKMRLKRDANGNYSYQFVSDEDSIRQAQQDLADAQNSLYNFDKDAYKNNLNDMYSVWSEFQDKVAQAYKDYADDQDALQEHIALLQEQYGEKINYLTEQNLNIRTNLTDSAFNDLANLYNVDVSNFQNMTDEEKDLIMNNLVPEWTSGVQEMIDKFSGEGGFEQTCQDTFDKLKEAAQDYVQNINNISQTNQRVSNEAYEEGQKLLQESNQLIDSAKQEYQAIGDVVNQVKELIAAYRQAKSEAIGATKAAYDFIQAKNAKDAAQAAEERRRAEEAAKAMSAANSSNSSSSDSGAGSGSDKDGTASVGDVVGYNGRYYYDSYGKAPAGSKYSGVADGVVIDKMNDNAYGVHIHSADGEYGDLGWIKKSQLFGYDTGGYTGTWGEDGRLALLHQKELVLNKDDTANMLSAMNVLRGIVSKIGDNVFNNTAAILSTIGSAITAPKDSSTLEQTVYITAKFEGQTEASQIETALKNLVNTASQRAYRNNK